MLRQSINNHQLKSVSSYESLVQPYNDRNHSNNSATSRPSNAQEGGNSAGRGGNFADLPIRL